MIPASKQLSSTAIWGFLQLGLLGIGASDFSLWAHHPVPREALAFPVLLAGQVIFIALLFPQIVPNASALMMSLALMLPTDELAGMLSTVSQAVIFCGFICVSLWTIGFGGLGSILKDPKKQLIAAACGMLICCGGAILDYLRWEAFATNGQPAFFKPVTLLPGLCNVRDGLTGWTWLQISTPALAFAAGQLVVLMRNHSQNVLHFPPPAQKSEQ